MLRLCLALVTCVLWAPFLVAQDMPYDVSATVVEYDTTNGELLAREGVEVRGAQGVISSDRLRYNSKMDTLKAEGNVRWVDSTGNVVAVDELELTEAMKRGTLAGLRVAMPKLGEVLRADSGTVSNTTYTLQNARYSPCPSCVDGVSVTQAWGFTADKVAYDTSESTVTYKGAVLDVKGVPVMYLPYFSHPVGVRKPRNGVLPPKVGYGSVMGAETTQGYYVWRPTENADYTLRTRLMAERGAQLLAERRQFTDHTTSELRGSYLNDNGTGKVRSHLQAMGEYVVRPGLRAGVNGELTSDDTYLNQFFSRTDPYLASTAYVELAEDDRYVALSGTHFRDLDIDADPANTAQVLPHLQLEQLLELDNNGGQLLLHADSLNLIRGAGARYRRLIGGAEYSRPVAFDDGSRVVLGASTRIDFYNVDGNNNNGNAARVLPEATAMWTKPYMSPAGTHTIAPTVMAAYSPRGGNPTEIPNEDSVAYELDVSNLFEPSRFAGLDRVESGPRVMYGLDNRWGPAAASTYRLFVGQSVRQFDDTALPASGGAATPVSDWVGYMAANPTPWLGLGQRFRLDNADFGVRRMDSSVRLGTEDMGRLLLNYSYLDNGPEEWSSDLRVPLMAGVEGLMRNRQDLASNKLLLAEAGVRITEDCYQIELIARRQGYEKGDVRPGTDFLINVQLLTLGDE